ncbi:MAG TPA: SRPBCC domain-containing protein [Roseomonas sp.]|jgi:uncharacterized protein YndB with AHSA1/START domain
MAASANPTEPEADRQVAITRVYDAPARLLFEAWSRPEHLLRWFGPKGWPLTLCEVDFRVGGRFRFAMTGSSGEQNTPFGGEYLEIVPDRRIVFSNRFEEPGSPQMIMTVSFEAMPDGRTTQTWHTLFESIAMRDAYLGMGFEQGAGSGLDQLADVVRDMAGR